MTKLQRFQDALSTLEVDAALISSQTNQRYLSDFHYTDGYLLITPKRAFLLADFRYAEAARASVQNFEVIRPEGDMKTCLLSLMRDHGVMRVALEDASLSCADYQSFSKAFEGITLCTGASEILKDLRTVKTEEELRLIERAQEITDLAFDHILGYLSPDVTEKDVALELEFFMRKHGADASAFDIIAVSGPASSLPHGVPSDVKLRAGFLTMDFGAKLDGYCSDMTRTVVIGRADEDMKRVYETVLSAQMAALNAISEGIGCRAADEVARDVIRKAGFGDCFGHSLGHGVGLDVHEAPSLSPRAKENAVLRRGNVVTVEPGIYLEGRYGCRIEDMVAVDHSGKIRNLTKSPKHLIEI